MPNLRAIAIGFKQKKVWQTIIDSRDITPLSGLEPMPTYSATGINVGSFNLGEADKVLTIFTAERGLLRAVAKGARKPGARVAGRAELLNVNSLLLASGRSLDIISQAEGLESFPKLRDDLVRLSYGLYYAELTQHFGQGLSEESSTYLELLRRALRQQAEAAVDGAWLCLQFEMALLDMLGYRPELTCCIVCREVLGDYTVSHFHQDWGGIICRSCWRQGRSQQVREHSGQELDQAPYSVRTGTEITPLVWKHLVLAAEAEFAPYGSGPVPMARSVQQSLAAARRIIQGYLEHRAGRRMKSLDLVNSLST